MLLHAWLMHTVPGKVGNGARVATIGARMQPVTGAAKIAVAPAIEAPVALPVETPTRTPAVDQPPALIAPAPPLAAEASLHGKAASVAGGGAPAQVQPSDPTYYAAGELDVFPRALVKPDLSAALTANAARTEPAAGNVRATVLIDEAGVVNAVRGVTAPAGDIETLARDLLLRTRFSPARNKEGRIVKAQVLIALDYDTRATPASR